MVMLFEVFAVIDDIHIQLLDYMTNQSTLMDLGFIFMRKKLNVATSKEVNKSSPRVPTKMTHLVFEVPRILWDKGDSCKKTKTMFPHLNI